MSLERKKMNKFFALTSLLCFVFLFAQRYEIIELKKEKVLLEQLNGTNKLRIEKQQKELEEITVQLMILSVLSGISEEQSPDCSFPKQKK
jgi:hypothetical protein